MQYNSPLGNPDGVNNNPVPGAEFEVVFWSPTLVRNVTIATQEFAGGIQSPGIGRFKWDYSFDAPRANDGIFEKRVIV